MDTGLLNELIAAFNEFEAAPPGTGRSAALHYSRGRERVVIVGDGPAKLLTPEDFERLVLNL